MKNWSLGKKIGVIAGAVVAVLVVIYLGMSFFYRGHYYPRTRINGANSSNASVASMEKRLHKRAADYKLQIVDENEKVETILPEDIDLDISVQKDYLTELMDAQIGFDWIVYLFQPKEVFHPEMVSFDEEKLAKVVGELDCVTATNPVKTEDAKLAFKDGKFEIQPEVYGTEIIYEDFLQKVSTAVLELEDTLLLKEDKCYKQPELLAASKEMEKACKTANRYVKGSITYTIGDKKEEVSKETIASWLQVAEDGTVTFVDEAMNEFIKEMAKRYDTYGKPKQLKTTPGAEVTVKGGNYGWKIDKEKELAQLKEDIESGKNVARDFIYSSVAANRSERDYGNSYVEVNLTAQHLYLYKDGVMIMDTNVVTGNPYKGNTTPDGAFQVTFKKSDYMLKGPDWYTHVDYWMPFCGANGMHDASWRSNFGGQIYRGNGSHGCVNIPSSKAKIVYDTVEAGFPVLVYYLGGTETVTDADVAAGKAVIAQINAIGEVNLGSEGAIVAARMAYDALNEEAKKCVDNGLVLIAAEIRLNELKQQASEAAAQQAAAQQAAMTQQAIAEATPVIAQIQSLGVITLESGPAITAAEQAYQNLSPLAKAQVPKDVVAILQNARQTFVSLNP